MVLAGKFTTERRIKAPITKWFNLITKQLHHVQNLCEKIHAAKLHQGDVWHNVGNSVKQWTYVIALKNQTWHIRVSNKPTAHDFTPPTRNFNALTKLNLFDKLDGKVRTCHETIEAIDEVNKTVIYKLYGEEIDQHYKTLRFIVELFDENNGGAVIKWSVEFETINENIEAPYGYVEFTDKCIRDMDAYLIKA